MIGGRACGACELLSIGELFIYLFILPLCNRNRQLAMTLRFVFEVFFFLSFCGIAAFSRNILETLVFLPSFNSTLRTFYLVTLATLHGSQNHKIGHKDALVQLTNILIAFKVK